jgi:hypothetical protein
MEDYQDEWAGQGGSYIIDEAGKRVRVQEPTMPAEEYQTKQYFEVEKGEE